MTCPELAPSPTAFEDEDDDEDEDGLVGRAYLHAE